MRRQSRREKVPGLLRDVGEPVAVAGRLAAEDDHAARPEDPEELGEGLVEVGDVVEDGVAEHHVEALVLEGQDFGFGDHGASPGRRASPRSSSATASIPGEMSVAVRLSIRPWGGEVQREVAGAGADLEGVAERLGHLAAEGALQLRSDLFLADVAEIDAPLGVVGIGSGIVVPGVHILDVVRRGGRGGGHAEKDREESPSLTETYVQNDQPEGVPPLELTGERTLPDVPEENYWYQRHLAVYKWISWQVAGKTVVDLACGEGYGSASWPGPPPT